MNILIPTFSFPFLDDNNFDGKFVLAEAQAYAENGADVKVITPHYHGIPKREVMEPGIDIFRFSYFFPRRWQCLKQPGRPLYDNSSCLAMIQLPFMLLAMLFTILRAGRWADIIHAQWTLTALLALPAKWLFGAKIVVTARGSDIRLLPVWLNRFIHGQVDAAIDCFGPQPWNEEYKKKFPARYLTLPLIVFSTPPTECMPQDMAKALIHRVSPFVIMYVGRFERLKISDNFLPLLTLIRAAGLWRQENLNIHLFYLGDGALRQDMEQLVSHLGLADWVTLLGPKNNVTDYLYHCDLGVGGIAFNAVSQEITMCGKPQLLVDSGDNQATPWVDNYNVFFIKPDDVEGLAARVKWVSQHPESLSYIVRQAKKDMNPYFVAIKPGGELYLRQFATLLAHTDESR